MGGRIPGFPVTFFFPSLYILITLWLMHITFIITVIFITYKTVYKVWRTLWQCQCVNRMGHEKMFLYFVHFGLLTFLHWVYITFIIRERSTKICQWNVRVQKLDIVIDVVQSGILCNSGEGTFLIASRTADILKRYYKRLIHRSSSRSCEILKVICFMLAFLFLFILIGEQGITVKNWTFQVESTFVFQFQKRKQTFFFWALLLLTH